MCVLPPVRPLLFGVACAAGAAATWATFSSTSQLFGRFPYRATPAGASRHVALTFDDGPNEPWTSRLLDTLGERGVRATFFQVGRCAERFPELTRRVVAEGHVLGNHSYSHAFRRYLTDPRQTAEIGRGRRVLSDIAGVEPLLYRPPWLCHTPAILHTLADSGATAVSGTFGSSLEVFQPAAARMTASTVARTRPGSIMIMHDGREARGGPRRQTVDSVGPTIDRLRDRGFAFVTVDQLLQVPAYA